MRGYEHYNFPAFDRYAGLLEKQGYTVVSPASLDRDAGFNPETDEVTPELIRQMILRDCDAITKVDCMWLMPEWERSRGVAVEKSLAEFLELPIYKLGDYVNG